MNESWRQWLGRQGIWGLAATPPLLDDASRGKILGLIRDDRLKRKDLVMRANIDMEVECDKAAVLDKVRTNREGHAKIVAEARVGFVEKAREVLTEQLDRLKKGKLKELSVHLAPPADHTREYDTVIRMLEMHTESTITLGASEVQMFIEDNWDWSDQFIMANSAYSGTAAARRGI